jgi:regulator of telomere elongation helicase 1
MMEGVIQCIKESKHGLIESPTGTGKTLSILCAAIAAVQKSRQDYVINEANRKGSEAARIDGSGETTAGEEEEKYTKEKSPDDLNAVAMTVIFCTRTHS